MTTELLQRLHEKGMSNPSVMPDEMDFIKNVQLSAAIAMGKLCAEVVQIGQDTLTGGDKPEIMMTAVKKQILSLVESLEKGAR